MPGFVRPRHPYLHPKKCPDLSPMFRSMPSDGDPGAHPNKYHQIPSHQLNGRLVFFQRDPQVRFHVDWWLGICPKKTNKHNPRPQPKTKLKKPTEPRSVACRSELDRLPRLKLGRASALAGLAALTHCGGCVPLRGKEKPPTSHDG